MFSTQNAKWIWLGSKFPFNIAAVVFASNSCVPLAVNPPSTNTTQDGLIAISLTG